MSHLDVINAALADARVHARASAVEPLLQDLERIERHAQDLAGELVQTRVDGADSLALEQKHRRQFQNKCERIERENVRAYQALEAFASLVTLMVGPKLHLADCPVLVDQDARCTGTCAEVHRVMGEWRVDVERALLRAEQQSGGRH